MASYPHSNKHKQLIQLALLKGNLTKLIGYCRRVLCVGSREMPWEKMSCATKHMWLARKWRRKTDWKQKQTDKLLKLLIH